MKDDDTTEELVACDGKATQRNIDIRNVALNVVEYLRRRQWRSKVGVEDR